MSKTIKEEWEVTISLTGVFRWPVEEGEEEEADFKKFLHSTEGHEQIAQEFQGALRRNPHLFSFGDSSLEIELVDLIKTETEVRSTDTDPRV